MINGKLNLSSESFHGISRLFPAISNTYGVSTQFPFKLLHQFPVDHLNVADVPSTTWRVPLQGRHLRRLLSIDKIKSLCIQSTYVHRVIQKVTKWREDNDFGLSYFASSY